MTTPEKKTETDLEREHVLLRLEHRVKVALYPPVVFYQETSIPPRYRAKTLAELMPDYEAKIRAAIQALKAGHNVVIHGGVGSGKTHLAVCLLWERWKQLVKLGLDAWGEPGQMNHPERDMRFRSSADLVQDLKQARSAWRSEQDLIDLETWPDVLLLDDLGFEERTELARSWLSTVLDRRYRSQKQTIITTNLEPDALSNVIDDRITSRLVETGLLVHLDGGDYRQKKARENRHNLYQRKES